MEIRLDQVSKRFGNTVIARDLSLHIKEGEKWHIAGSNGRGKSSLMQILAAYSSPDLGSIEFLKNNTPLKPDLVFKELSISTPYTDLIFDYTLQEQFDFHFQFKQLLFDQKEFEDWVKLAKLDSFKNRNIGLFSSGMKQKAKLLLALCSTASCIFLDEPCSNLDADGKHFYKQLVNRRLEFPATWIICSNNQPEEHFFCTQTLNLDELTSSHV